jgi:hypothetical protein
VRWYWHVVALTLLLGGPAVAIATGVPAYGWVAIATWFALWYLVVRRRVVTR